MNFQNIYQILRNIFFYILIPISISNFQARATTSDQISKVDHYLELLESYKSNNKLIEQCEVLNKIAYIYWETENYSEALNYFFQSLELNKKLGNKNAIKSIYNSIGMIYTDLGQHEKALEAFNENLKIEKSVNNKEDLASSYLNISMAYENLEKFQEAVSNLQIGLEIAKEQNNIKLMRRIYSALAENFDKLGNKEKSMEYLNLYISLDKLLQSEEFKMKDQKIKQMELHTQNIVSEISKQGQRLEKTETSLKEVEQLTREKQMEIDMLTKDKLIQTLKIRQQEAQLQFERKIRTILIIGITLISLLASIIYLLYRRLKDREKKLLESEEKFRRLFEESEDSLMLIDENGIIDSNNACVKYFGFENRKELQKSNLFKIFPEKQIDGEKSSVVVSNMIEQAFKSGYSRAEVLIKKNNGLLSHVDLSHTSLFIHDQKVLYSIWRDIDKQKEVEEELKNYKNHLEELVLQRTDELEKAKERAEESDKLKSRFLANLSHEIKTPLNAIIGISKMLMKYHSTNLSSKQNECITVIHDSGNRLFKLLDDIIEYSKIQAGIIDIKKTLVDSKIFFSQINYTAKKIISDKQLNFLVHGVDDFPEKFAIDLVRFMNIWENLIDNAVKFSEKGNINFIVSKHNSSLIFEMEDPGQGINAEDMSKLFLGFRQIDDSASRKHGGTGLGLAICKGLLDIMRGTIIIKSKINEGTSVKIEIPFEE